MRKLLSFCAVLIVLTVLSSGCEPSIYMKEKAAQQAVKVSQTEKVSQKTQAPAIPIYSKQEINQMVAKMKQDWQLIDRKATSMEISQDAYGIKRYSENKLLKKTEVAKGTYGDDDLGYDRKYYFNDKGLFFATVTDGTKTMRFYFYGGRLLRFIDSGNRAIDQASDNQEFDQYDRSLAIEASQVWNDYEEEKLILNYYVHE